MSSSAPNRSPTRPVTRRRPLPVVRVPWLSKPNPSDHDRPSVSRMSSRLVPATLPGSILACAWYMRRRLICFTPCSTACSDSTSPSFTGIARASASDCRPAARTPAMRPGINSIDKVACSWSKASSRARLVIQPASTSCASSWRNSSSMRRRPSGTARKGCTMRALSASCIRPAESIRICCTFTAAPGSSTSAGSLRRAGAATGAD
jgi:hypothetical protein